MPDHSTLHLSIHLASYFDADCLTLHPSIHLESYFCADHKVVFRVCYGAYFVAHDFNIWHQILFPGDLYDAVL